MLVPRCANHRLIGERQFAQSTTEQSLFSRYKPIEPSIRWFQKPRLSPIGDWNIKWADWCSGSDPTDQHILSQIKQHRRRSRLTEHTGSEWKTAEKNIAEQE